jgi:hypothetical protein
MRALPALLFVTFGLLPVPAPAGEAPPRSVGGLFAPAAVHRHPEAAPPLRLAEPAQARPFAVLRAAAASAPGELAELAAWNRAGHRPPRNGFARALPTARRVDLATGPEGPAGGEHAGGVVARLAGGGLVWGAEVRVEGAYRLRLHLAAVDLPPGTLLWVYGAKETVGSFGLELRAPAGDLWTPSVGGGTIWLKVQVPAGGRAASFVLDHVLELFPLGRDRAPPAGGERAAGAGLPPCLIDAQCVPGSTFDALDLVQRATGHLEFVDGFLGFLCTGGLLNDVTGSGIPYLLTANHCFDEQASAATLEVFWDDHSATCGAPPPPLESLPRSNGSLLLASSSSSDFTLVRLYDLPSGRFLLGWNADPAAAADDTVLHRVSHPLGLNQHYSRNHVDALFSAPSCHLGFPRPGFLYETFEPALGDQGGTFGGSSGAPAIARGPQPLDVWVVGQLLGACGPDPSDGCDYANREIDGAFSASFGGVGAFLTDTLFLLGSRFRVVMQWAGTPPNDIPRRARVGPSSTASSGSFYFFNPDNSEVLVKVIDGCSLNGRYWVFFTAATDVGYTLKVTDTLSPSVPPRTYTNTLGTPAQPVQDTSAFATCP